MGWAENVEFVDDAHFSPGWEEEKKAELQQRAKELMAREDLDLIITAGTAATKTILDVNNGTTPILAIAVSDPIKSRFVLNETDSGVENFTVRIVLDRFKRMFTIFHDVVGFKKLGILYPDTEEGKNYTNAEDARQVAQERGFELLEYTEISTSETTEECMEGIQWLAEQGMDAFFIPSLNCFDWTTSDVDALFTFLSEHKIPTFSREGTKNVKAGALMGFSTQDFDSRGEFLADKIVRIFQGESPRSLPMVDDAIPKITLNLYVAEQVGFDAPFDLLGASDEIFQEILLPEDRLVK
jgi:ABC-type uncharacterized transport system substrate-binding protein